MKHILLQISSLWANLTQVQFCRDNLHRAQSTVATREQGISLSFLCLCALIQPSLCRGRNYSWKMEQVSGFYACRRHSSARWPKEVRSEAINKWGKKVAGLSILLLHSTHVCVVNYKSSSHKREKKPQHFSYWILHFFCFNKITGLKMSFVSHRFFWC